MSTKNQQINKVSAPVSFSDRIPDISNEKYSMMTSAGVVHMPDGNKISSSIGDLSKLDINIAGKLCFCNTGYSEVFILDKKDDCLVIRFFKTRVPTWGVDSYKNAIKECNDEGKKWFDDSCNTTWYINNLLRKYPEIISEDTVEEIRIYNDRKIVDIIKIAYKDGSYKYYNYNKLKDIAYRNYSVNLEEDKLLTITQELAKIEFHNEDEVKAARHSVTKVGLWGGYYGFYSGRYATISDVSDVFLSSCSQVKYLDYPYRKFCERTQNILNSFFNLNNEDTKKILSQTSKIDYSASNNNFDSLNTLKCFLAVSATGIKIKENRDDLVKRLTQIPELKWDEDEKKIYSSVWTRTPEYIVAKIYSRCCSSALLFAYNIKDKTKILAYTYNGGKDFYYKTPSGPILSGVPFGHISYEIDYDHYRNGEYKYTYYDALPPRLALPLRQLFDGTNIAWMLDNPEALEIVAPEGFYTTRKGDNQIKKIKDILNEKELTEIVLFVLASTSNRMLEMALKAKLFNIYIIGLAATAERYTEPFFNVKKLTHNSDDTDYLRETCGSICLRDDKRRNLKAMFGMSQNQLKILDKKLGEYMIENRNNPNDKGRKFNEYPYMVGVDFCLGRPLNMIDDKTFERIVEISRKVRATDGYYSSSQSPWRVMMPIINERFAHLKPAERIAFVESYASKTQIMKDYYRMREKLKNLQSVITDGTIIFSEHKYPIKPAKTTKFISFVRGMRLCDTGYTYSYGGNSELRTEEEFLKGVSRRYDLIFEGKYAEYGREDYEINNNTTKADVYTNDAGEVSGVKIELSAAEHLQYLHDEASIIIGALQDKEKNKLFTEAVKRVKPFEYKDEKVGLEIKAPQVVGDITREGSVLSHCVASYVDPIIDGTENIVFIRRVDMPDDPYYTLELIANPKNPEVYQIRQIHNYRNGDTTAESQQNAYIQSGYSVYNKTFDIIGFLKGWAKKMGKNIDASTIKTSYSALCAVR